MVSASRKDDTVARFGGGEFLLIFPDLDKIEDATRIAQNIIDRFNKLFVIDSHNLILTTSIGIAIFPDDGIDEITLLKNADIAMYKAKQGGRAQYRLFEKE